MSHGNPPRNVRPQEGKAVSAAVSTFDVTTAISDAMKRAFGNERNVAKRIAREAGSSERAAKNWLERKNAMTLAQFFTLARRVPELKALAADLLELQPDVDPEFMRDFTRAMQTFQRAQEARNAAMAMDRTVEDRRLGAAPSHPARGLASEPGRGMDEAPGGVVGPAR